MSVDVYGEMKVVEASIANANGNVVLAAGNAGWISIDRLGFESVSFVVGTLTGLAGTANLYLDESEDESTWTPVPSAKIRGKAAAATAAGLIGPFASLTTKIAVISTTSKARYLRLRQGDSSGVSGTGYAVALLSNPHRSPVAQATW